MASESQECNTSHPSSGIREFRLYVAGQTPKSVLAYANLQKICETYLQETFRIEVIDVLDDPNRAQQDNILVVPTLVQCYPAPLRRIVGDLTDTAKVLTELNLQGFTDSIEQSE